MSHLEIYNLGLREYLVEHDIINFMIEDDKNNFYPTRYTTLWTGEPEHSSQIRIYPQEDGWLVSTNDYWNLNEGYWYPEGKIPFEDPNAFTKIINMIKKEMKENIGKTRFKQKVSKSILVNE